MYMFESFKLEHGHQKLHALSQYTATSNLDDKWLGLQDKTENINFERFIFYPWRAYISNAIAILNVLMHRTYINHAVFSIWLEM